MIKKTFLTTATLLICYSVLIKLLPTSFAVVPQHQWQENIIKAQRLQYNTSDTFDNVIVGSSLANRLADTLFRKTYKLAFSGGSIFDGLSILSHSKAMPKQVFIEMNMVFRQEDEKFTQNLNSPTLFYLKKELLFLQEEKQPVTLLASKVKQLLSPKKQRANEIVPEPLFKILLANQAEVFSKSPEPALVKQSFQLLQAYVKEIESKGGKVIFFEMPVNPRIYNLPKAKITRNNFYTFFPKQQYEYMPLPSSEEYSTTDGIHLTLESAQKYSLFFSNYLYPSK
jgi:hypothetical protein